MIIKKSTGLGSEYVVYCAKDKTVVPDVVVIIPEYDNASVAMLRHLGETAWADKLDKQVQEILNSKTPSNDL